MTTATPGYTPTRSGGSVVGPLVATGLVGGLSILLGALLSGVPAASGAAIGAVMVCLFFGVGAVVLGAVAKIAPAASLLIALLTYTLKVVLIGLVFFGLSTSGALETAVDGVWLGVTVIVCTLVWLSALILTTVRARQPIYDLPSDGQEASVR